MRKMYIKNKLLLLLLFLLVFSVKKTNVNAEDTDVLYQIIKETANAYYRDSTNAQYNSNKSEFFSPEEATSQDVKYNVCSRFTSNVFNEGLGIGIPGDTGLLRTYALRYYNLQTSLNEEGPVIFLSKCYTDRISTEGTGLTEEGFNELIGNLEIGDLIVYAPNGHVILVYDKFVDSNGKNDVCIMHSRSGYTINSKITGTDSISFSKGAYRNTRYSGINNLEIVRDTNDASIMNNPIVEGSIQISTLRTFLSHYRSGYFDLNKFNCTWRDPNNPNSYPPDYAILRIVKKNDDGTYSYYPVLNGNETSIQPVKLDINNTRGMFRTKFPTIKIEKTVNAHDNDIVEANETLTYNIQIQNNNKNNNSENAYPSFCVQETIDNSNLVEYLSSSHPNNTVVEIVNNKIIITYGVEYLKTTLNLKYNLRVKSNNTLNKTITVSGKLYVPDTNASGSTLLEKCKSTGYNISTSQKGKFLTTGTITNTISTKLTDEQKLIIKESYNNKKNNYSGLELINETYKALNIDLNLDTFDFSKLFVRDSTDCGTTKPKYCRYYAKLNNYPIGTTSNKYNDMILNNYYNIVLNENGFFTDQNNQYDSYTGLAFLQSKKNYTIYSENFEDGDILIYKDYNTPASNISVKTTSNENGIYAYIYIDGKFIGINNNTNASRNEFAYSYYQTNNIELYNNVGNIDMTGSEEFMNYQTLFSKAYYVILRPSLVGIETLSNDTKYILTYDSNGGVACSPSSKSVDRDTKVGELCKPTKKDCSFDGWWTAPVGGTRVTSETIVSNDITIYAHWNIVNPATGIVKPVLIIFATIGISILGYYFSKKENHTLE